MHGEIKKFNFLTTNFFQIRNIIQHEAIDKKQILGSLNEIVSLVKSCPHEEITVEVSSFFYRTHF